jgi:hypothetical protein
MMWCLVKHRDTFSFNLGLAFSELRIVVLLHHHRHYQMPFPLMEGCLLAKLSKFMYAFPTLFCILLITLLHLVATVSSRWHFQFLYSPEIPVVIHAHHTHISLISPVFLLVKSIMFWMWCHVVWQKFSDITEECTGSICRIAACLAYLVTLKMEAVCCFETSVNEY